VLLTRSSTLASFCRSQFWRSGRFFLREAPGCLYDGWPRTSLRQGNHCSQVLSGRVLREHVLHSDHLVVVAGALIGQYPSVSSTGTYSSVVEVSVRGFDGRRSFSVIAEAGSSERDHFLPPGSWGRASPSGG